MKKTGKLLILAFVVAMVMALTGCGSKSGIFDGKDFRNSSWDDSKDACMDAETAEVFLEGDFIVHYKGSFADFDDAVITYQFKDDKLCKGGIMIDCEDEDEAQAGFEKIQEMLEKGYGKSTNTIGSTIIFQNDKTSVEYRLTGKRIDLSFGNINFGK